MKISPLKIKLKINIYILFHSDAPFYRHDLHDIISKIREDHDLSEANKFAKVNILEFKIWCAA